MLSALLDEVDALVDPERERGGVRHALGARVELQRLALLAASARLQRHRGREGAVRVPLLVGVAVEQDAALLGVEAEGRALRPELRAGVVTGLVEELTRDPAVGLVAEAEGAADGEVLGVLLALAQVLHDRARHEDLVGLDDGPPGAGVAVEDRLLVALAPPLGMRLRHALVALVLADVHVEVLEAVDVLLGRAADGSYLASSLLGDADLRPTGQLPQPALRLQLEDGRPRHGPPDPSRHRTPVRCLSLPSKADRSLIHRLFHRYENSSR